MGTGDAQIRPPPPDWSSKAFVLSRVSRRGTDLRFVSETLADDIDVVRAALAQDIDSACFASLACIEVLYDEAIESGDTVLALHLARLFSDTPRSDVVTPR